MSILVESESGVGFVEGEAVHFGFPKESWAQISPRWIQVSSLALGLLLGCVATAFYFEGIGTFAWVVGMGGAGSALILAALVLRIRDYFLLSPKFSYEWKEIGADLYSLSREGSARYFVQFFKDGDLRPALSLMMRGMIDDALDLRYARYRELFASAEHYLKELQFLRSSDPSPRLERLEGLQGVFAPFFKFGKWWRRRQPLLIEHISIRKPTLPKWECRLILDFLLNGAPSTEEGLDQPISQALLNKLTLKAEKKLEQLPSDFEVLGYECSFPLDALNRFCNLKEIIGKKEVTWRELFYGIEKDACQE